MAWRSRRHSSAIVSPKSRYLQWRAVLTGKGEGPVLGIVASLSDVTRQYELQQTKNDVISLVSHEMRTPLTAIQGMTELLAAYDVEPVRRREMNLAINDEVKRLTGMITGYLDITRLESGATAMRLSPVRAESLLERILILLEPVAAQRHIRLVHAEHLHRLVPVGGFGDHRHIVLHIDDRGDSHARHQVIFSYENSNFIGHGNGTVTSTSVPDPGLLSNRSSPPSRSARSRIPINPKCPAREENTSC